MSGRCNGPERRLMVYVIWLRSDLEDKAFDKVAMTVNEHHFPTGSIKLLVQGTRLSNATHPTTRSRSGRGAYSNRLLTDLACASSPSSPAMRTISLPSRFNPASEK